MTVHPVTGRADHMSVMDLPVHPLCLVVRISAPDCEHEVGVPLAVVVAGSLAPYPVVNPSVRTVVPVVLVVEVNSPRLIEHAWLVVALVPCVDDSTSTETPR